MDRRSFLQSLALAAAPAARFFRLEQRKGRWLLLDPAGRPFYTLAMNHIDPATIRYADSGGVWEREYGNDMRRWLTAVRRDLHDWGFNSVGWVQEVVTINDQNHRHSRGFTFEEYQWLDMPYCHLLPFLESHQWEIETRLPKIDSAGFAEWCDYVARDQCSRFRGDPKLIGYFYTDCPTWVHSRKGNEWKAPLFDPKELATESGRKELLRLAGVYYRVLHEAVRRYDPHHLIFGDRYEALAPLPEQVVQAALPYVDVLSFQCFAPPDEIGRLLSKWAEFSRKPVLLADSAHRKQPAAAPGDRPHDPELYARALDVLLGIPACIGYHLCGAYLRNRARRSGFRDERNQPAAFAARFGELNRGALERFARLAAE